MNKRNEEVVGVLMEVLKFKEVDLLELNAITTNCLMI